MKDEYIRIRLTANEKQKLKELAEIDNRTMSGWIINQINREYRLGKKGNTMKHYVIQDREAGNIIETTITLEKAQSILADYEEQDKADGTYTENFYEIQEVDKEMSYNDKIEILMEDRCTKKEAEKHLKDGAVIWYESEKEEFINSCIAGLCDREDAEDSWEKLSIVVIDGAKYRIEYVL